MVFSTQLTNAGDWGSIPNRDRPKSLKQVVTALCQMLGNRCARQGSSDMTIIKGCPVSQYVKQVNCPHCSRAMSVKYISKFVAL